MARLQEKFSNELHEQIQKKLGFENAMQVPKITKVTLNMGVGEAVADKKVLENALADMEKIAGQKAQKTLARKSVAGFKIRDGYPIGCKVTLRRERMYEFLDRGALRVLRRRATNQFPLINRHQPARPTPFDTDKRR